jgi:transposase InsO family protein
LSSKELKEYISKQYKLYPDWSYRLHADNIAAAMRKSESLGDRIPSYQTVTRFMKQSNLYRKKKVNRKQNPGMKLAQSRLEKAEVRSFEMDYVGALYHFDFHKYERKVLNSKGQLIIVKCFAIHDDHSRLACHIQWYDEENTENLVHGICQAFMKRGLPRALLSDNGKAMKASAFVAGVVKLGILHNYTLAYSPHQNGKTERFWGSLEGRLMAMLKGKENITLDFLNEVTQAWVEMEYNRKINKEMGCSPYDRILNSPDVTRKSPSWEELKLAFRKEVIRSQRKNDQTVSLEGVRYEIPGQYRTLKKIRLRYAPWNLSLIHMVDDEGKTLAKLYPQDKSRNADASRRKLDYEETNVDVKTEDIPPLLEEILKSFAETGLPAAYIPSNKDEQKGDENE